MSQMKAAFRAAVDNIARYGDTDVFPYPLENHVFFDTPDKVVDALEQIHSDLNRAITANAPIAEGMLAAVGYTGFRSATQIDPLWNAYFLALVISAGPSIEQARISKERGNIFSYRFLWDESEKTLFDKHLGWLEFQKTSVERAREFKYVLVCDISDFYPRIYHHRLENALAKATGGTDEVWRIMKLLMNFSNNVSYGLPVGGPAARLLSELLLNRVDRLLLSSGVVFCRFADDYHVFASSTEEAYQHLILLNEKLLANEGLLLQKSKTRVMTSEEFLSTSEFAAENEPESDDEKQGREFLRLRLHFDPYSSTREEDYEALKSELARFDVLGMLGREMRKSRVNPTLTRKLVGSLRVLDGKERDAMVLSLMENLHVLYPIYSSVMLLLKHTIGELTPSAREEIFSRLRLLIASGSYVVQVPTHLAFTIRVLANDSSEETDELLSSIYNSSRLSAIRRDVILAMAKRNADYWISDVRKNFATLTEWERTALVAASYILGDEGKHWRNSVKGSLSPMQELVRDWAATRPNPKEIPL